MDKTRTVSADRKNDSCFNPSFPRAFFDLRIATVACISRRGHFYLVKIYFFVTEIQNSHA